MSAMVREVEATDADLEAFAYVHPYTDRRQEEQTLVDFGNGSKIVNTYERREIFSFSSEDVGEVLFDVRGIKDALARKELEFTILEAELSFEWVEHIRNHGGVEILHMTRLTDADCARAGVAVWWGNLYTTLIDGNNRLVRRYDNGLRTFRFARVPFTEAMMRFICRPGEEEGFFEPLPSGDYDDVTLLAKKVGVS